MKELVTVTVFSKCPPKLLTLGLPAVWRAAYTFDVYHEKEMRAFVADQRAQLSTINVVVE